MNIDYSKLAVGVGLTPLDGGTPPDCCPVCSSRRMPSECDDGWPPPEQWVYFCEGSYARPEDEEAAPVWVPRKRCGEVPTEDALAWLSDRCSRDLSFASVDAVLARAVRRTPDWVTKSPSLLFVGLPNIPAPQPPERCPICGAEGHRFSASIHEYECDAHYGVTSERRGPDGKLTPATWGPLSPCGRPPIATILRVLRARDEPEWTAVCDEALATLG